ncbi:MAG: hypothetical protein L6V85_04360 [Clostridiales bacterium]|nr:MAG: hypothetical protein L6V85_04360 [Clostridiales bacterium]
MMKGVLYLNILYRGFAKRVDVVFLHKNVVYLLEFKCGETEYKKGANEQVLDYALDLQNFQKESHDKIIIPIVVATEAKTIENSFIVKGNIAEPLFCNRGNIGETIALIDEKNLLQQFQLRAVGKLGISSYTYNNRGSAGVI